MFCLKFNKIYKYIYATRRLIFCCSKSQIRFSIAEHIVYLKTILHENVHVLQTLSLKISLKNFPPKRNNFVTFALV